MRVLGQLAARVPRVGEGVVEHAPDRVAPGLLDVHEEQPVLVGHPHRATLSTAGAGARRRHLMRLTPIGPMRAPTAIDTAA